LPGALVMLALSSFYMLYNDAPVIEALFFGIKAAVLAVVVEAVIRIGKRALKNRVMVAIAVAAFLAIYVLKLPFPLIVLAAGLIGWVGKGNAAADRGGVVDLMFERGELGHTVPTKWHAARTIAIWLPIWLGPVALIAVLAGPGSVWAQIGGFFSLMAVVTFGGAYAVLA
ncbi:MAG: chromate transporter, partial [Mesorhizobium sp.]